MKNINNHLSEYQSPPKEALRNFGIDISREAVEKYALEKFGRVPKTQAERDCVIADKCKTEISGKLE